jgi:iron complex outermembrane receptor protein
MYQIDLEQWMLQKLQILEQTLQMLENFGRNPDANNINGAPETAAAKFFLINSEYKLSEQTDLYFNAAFIKKVNSFANYRTPYWRTVESMPYLANFFLE